MELGNTLRFGIPTVVATATANLALGLTIGHGHVPSVEHTTHGVAVNTHVVSSEWTKNYNTTDTMVVDHAADLSPDLSARTDGSGGGSWNELIQDIAKTSEEHPGLTEVEIDVDLDDGDSHSEADDSRAKELEDQIKAVAPDANVFGIGGAYPGSDKPGVRLKVWAYDETRTPQCTNWVQLERDETTKTEHHNYPYGILVPAFLPRRKKQDGASTEEIDDTIPKGATALEGDVITPQPLTARQKAILDYDAERSGNGSGRTPASPIDDVQFPAGRVRAPRRGIEVDADPRWVGIPLAVAGLAISGYLVHSFYHSGGHAGPLSKNPNSWSVRYDGHSDSAQQDGSSSKESNGSDNGTGASNVEAPCPIADPNPLTIEDNTIVRDGKTVGTTQRRYYAD